MKPHPQIRKTIKWGGAAVTVLLVVVWIGSGWWNAVQPITRSTSFGFSDGCVQVTRWVQPPGWTGNGWFGRRPTAIGIDLTGGFGDVMSANRLPLTWLPKHIVWIGGESWHIPIWIVIVPCLLLTAIAWRRDTLARRRARLNLCPKCNYDRTGLTLDAKCPECGTTSESG